MCMPPSPDLTKTDPSMLRLWPSNHLTRTRFPNMFGASTLALTKHSKVLTFFSVRVEQWIHQSTAGVSVDFPLGSVANTNMAIIAVCTSAFTCLPAMVRDAILLLFDTISSVLSPSYVSKVTSSSLGSIPRLEALDDCEPLPVPSSHLRRLDGMSKFP